MVAERPDRGVLRVDGKLGSPWQKIVLANRSGHVIGDLLKGTHSRISGLDFSPDGKRIAYTLR